jgi:RNA-binding protein
MSRREIQREYGSELTDDERRALQEIGHDLDPVVWVGRRGISDGLVENIDNQLLAHELIKVKVHEPAMLEDVAEALNARCDAQVAQSIGNILLAYRAHPEEPELLS